MVSSMCPLVCTQNTLSHIDYGTPILASKSTDYRTSTAKNHQLIPEIPQQFDCRVQVHVKPGQFLKHVAVREENNKSTQVADYKEKGLSCFLDRYGRASNNREIRYMQNTQEKLFKNPAQPIKPKVSEMKESYRMCYRYPQEQDVALMPPRSGICEAQTHQRGVQCSIQPAEKGCTKYTDIYLTENKAQYVPYSIEQLEKAQEDFVTYYNSHGKWKGLKEELPGRPHGNKTVFDKCVFAWEAPCRFLARPPIKHICQESETEFQDKYINPHLSCYFPYIFENSVSYEDCLPNAGPWQTLCPPGMYRTEYSHIGRPETELTLRAVVDIGAARDESFLPPHELCNVRVNTK